jgi:Holliday junction DNA helicase RuvA
MIAQLEGIISYVGETFAIVNVQKIGFRVNLCKDTLLRIGDGDAIRLWTYLAVREDALDLYGFAERSELVMFEKLLTLPGIGPKSALGFISAAGEEVLRKAVVSQDAGYLTKVSGIGRKSAEKIVAGLKDKIEKTENEKEAPHLREEADAIEAIKSLGYSAQDAREALRALPQEISGVSNRIKAALKYLGK